MENSKDKRGLLSFLGFVPEHLSKAQQRNYSWDLLIIAFILVTFKYGNTSILVDNIVTLCGFVFVVGCIIYSSISKKLLKR